MDDDENDDNLALVEVDDDSDEYEDAVEEGDMMPGQQPVSNVTFDTTLPVSHAYLGSDLEEVHGRTWLGDEHIIDLPLFPLQNVVLFPDQTLPLHLFQQAMVKMMRYVLNKDRTFGMVNLSGMKCSEFGTTAEVVAYREESDDDIGMSTLRLKAIGRQRFKLLSMRRQIDGILVGKARILPELTLGDPLQELRLTTHPRQSFVAPDRQRGAVARPVAPDRQGGGGARPVCDRYFCSAYTPWPPWVYRMYDTNLLMSKMKKELRSWNQAVDIDSLPPDPSDFSFWVASNLPLVDEMKLNLLSLSSPIQRLRMEYSILTKCTVLCCRNCQAEISRKEHVFSLSVVGPLSAYVNPHGHVHETLTVCQVSGVASRGRASTEASWFPGYAWTIIECRSCSQHMGWKFTATKHSLQPQKFWGVCRASIIPSIDEGAASDDDDDDDFHTATQSSSNTSYITATSSISNTSDPSV